MIRVLIVGVGRMGFAHATSASKLTDVELCGLVARDFRKWQNVCSAFPDVPLYNDYKAALSAAKPDAVIISSYTDTHALYASMAMEAGAHVFVEKPLGLTKREAGYSIAKARQTKRKLMVGYILRHHDMWNKFVELSKSLTGPLNVKITSNQYSKGEEWKQHKNILNAGLSPIVDCGIHYIDIVNQICDGEVVEIEAVGVITEQDITIPNVVGAKFTYSDGSQFIFESGFGPSIDPDLKAIREVVAKDGRINVTHDDRLIHNGFERTYDDDIYDQSIDAQQKSFFNAIKNDINLEEHWIGVALSHAIALIAEEEMKINS
ncbi:MAG: Gfo/Idh/MocA family oxidoreductase [Emcibacteraceae bacterium]|nr:Gfo/Idh/MocA family oxidoreductase [Emcibacteraceae bacterium]MDG1859859.1 Gfo/Idh/MocA family oxidoreductase [Emcibacteraceae bacterium]